MQEHGVALTLAKLDQLRSDPEQVKRELQKFEDETGKALTEEEYLEALANPFEHIQMQFNEKVALGISLGTTDGLAAELLSLNWCLCTAPHDTVFTTCDARFDLGQRRGSLGEASDQGDNTPNSP